jgi:hypothetical protein
MLNVVAARRRIIVMATTIALLFLSLAVWGCSQSTYLTKPGLNDEMFARDSEACAEYRRQESLFNGCMTARGYTTVRAAMLPKLQWIR